MGVCKLYKFYSGLATAYFVLATVLLMMLAFLLLATSLWEVAVGLSAGRPIEATLSGVSLLIIGFAVVETAKFIAEEEVMRKRELRSSTESRRSITKFITIIVIATSMEALVMVFNATREDLRLAIYPAALFTSVVFALVALGAYQWLSSRIDNGNGEPIPPGEAENGGSELPHD